MSIKGLARASLERFLGRMGYELRPAGATVRGYDSFVRFVCSRYVDPRTVYDIGVGYGTPWLYRGFPRAHFALFEALPVFPREFKELPAGRFDYHQVGLGSVPVELEMFVPSGAPTSSSMRPMTDAFARMRTTTGAPLADRAVRVKVETLDSFNPYPGPYVMKLDVEGGEIDVLRGGMRTLEQTELVISEVSVVDRFEGGASVGEFFEFMEDQGFRFFDIVNASQGFDDGRLVYADLAFIKPSALERAERHGVPAALRQPAVRERVRSMRSQLRRVIDRARHSFPQDCCELGVDPGNDAALRSLVVWLGRAQDHSRTADGGLARHWSSRNGWAASYPETTGFAIPTMLAVADRGITPDAEERARRMLDWLLTVQRDDGSFAGGTVVDRPQVAVTFNTGQALLGLAAAAARYGEPYRAAMTRAADWMTATQDDDGCWRSFPTPFAVPGDKTYETHAAWGLLEAAAAADRQDWCSAALRQVDWALTQQHPNGWLSRCCLVDESAPLTHTLGYALRGFIEAWHHSERSRYFDAALRLGQGLLDRQNRDGSIPGCLDSSWRPTVSWVCVTGVAQTSICWILLARATADERWWSAARRANQFLRRAIVTEPPADRVGSLPGSMPVNGQYCRYEYPNWGVKFAIDALLLEQATEVQGETTSPRARPPGPG